MKTGLLVRPKKLLQLLLVLLVAGALNLVSTSSALASSATLYIDPSSSVATADTIGASVRLSADDNKITFVNFNVSYDTSKLEFTGSEQSGSPLSNPRGNGRSGSISVAAGSMEDRVSGDVPIIGLRFRILDRTGSTTLSFSNAGVYDDNFVNVASSTSGAVYDFDGTGPADPSSNHQSPAITPAPAIAVAPAATPARPPAMPAAKQKKTTASVPEVTNGLASTTLHAPAVEIPLAHTAAPRDEFPDRKGSVFLTDDDQPQRQFAFLNWRWLPVAGAIGVTAGVFVIWRRYAWTNIRRYAYRFRRKAYEVIPPLASLWPDGEDELNDHGVKTTVPYIPIVQPEVIPATNEEEIDQEWKYDINSPLMNTL